jgi:hypothetical protein
MDQSSSGENLVEATEFLFPRQSLEKTLTQQPFRGDVTVFNVREEFRFNPCGLGLLERLCQS